VVCVEGRGEATGLLLEQAAYRAWAGAPEPTMRERGAHVLAALEDLQRLGFSEVHDLHSQDWLGPMLSGLAREGRLPVDRVWLYPPVERLRASVEAAGGWESERVVLAGGKVFADGTLNSRTALMLHDYRSALPGMERGKAMLSAPALEDAMRLTQSLGVGLAVHAIGDGAVRMVLDAWERARPRGGPGWLRRSGAGIPCLRIEHCEVIDRADIGRFAPMGVVCSVQPCHLLADIEALRR
jgi:predicted amidohydrolase YtcJ